MGSRGIGSSSSRCSRRGSKKNRIGVGVVGGVVGRIGQGLGVVNVQQMRLRRVGLQVVRVAEIEGYREKLKMILCTHKHADHSGGNENMAKRISGMEVVSTAYEGIPGITKSLRDKEIVKLGSLSIQALYTPCHTSGHILFFVTNEDEPTKAPLLFSGDTLFVGGCGRFFEGSSSQMVTALRDVVAKLPLNTRIFCGHEYTETNLKFAMSIDPTNFSLHQKSDWVKNRRAENLPTVPSTLSQEISYNPFLRLRQPQLRAAVGVSISANDDEVMAAIRQRKDGFKG